MVEIDLDMGNTAAPIAGLEHLRRERFWGAVDLYELEGYWYYPQFIGPIKALQSHFRALDDDVLVATPLKTGTTWLKALAYCIMQGPSQDQEDALETNNPHDCVPTLEAKVYAESPQPDLSGMPSPRVFHTHLPYNILQDSVKNSSCKIVFLARNPKDTLISTWHFINKVLGPIPLEKAVDTFCRGVHVFGPFFDQVLGYWNESLKRPQNVLFMKYEDLQRNPQEEVKRLASFIGRPFKDEEEVQKVLWKCSIGRLKELEINKSGKSPWSVLPNNSFFRLGVVGDWKNHLTPEMADRIDQLTKMKLEGTGLRLDD